MTIEITVAADAVHSDSVRAWVASEPLRTEPSLPQGARTISPIRGSTRKATATSAGPSNGAGTDLGPPPLAARRARSRAVSRDGLATVPTVSAVGTVWAAPICRQGFSKPSAASTAWPAGEST